jgi:cytosine/adenosine deaminase-related metal-dependent hydrolase
MARFKHITGARIATLVDGADIVDNTDVWIEGTRIAALLPAGAAPPWPAIDAGQIETIAVNNGVVLPGAINAHTHSASALQRGTVPGAPLDLFVLEAMARRAPKPARQIQVAILAQAAESLRHGITSMVDHFRHGAMPTIDAIAAAVAAYDQSGLRAAIAPMFEDRLYLDSLPLDQDHLPPAVRDRWQAMRLLQPADYFAMMDEAIAAFKDHDRMQILLGVDGPQRCSAALLEQAGAFAARHGIGAHTHLLEAKTQALVAPAECGRSFVEYLDRFGLVGPATSFAHFVWCTQADVELAAARGATAVHNPVSNLVLGSGVAPVARMLRSGLNVALGTDGSSSNGISLFEQAKFAMLLSRISETDPDRWLTARQAITMASRRGAAVLSKSADLGVIAPGALADLMIINLDAPAHHPLGNIWTHLVMYETGENVDTVIVNGEILVRGGRCTHINEADLRTEIDDYAARDHAANEPFLAATGAEKPVFQALIREALDRPAGINRWLAFEDQATR